MLRPPGSEKPSGLPGPHTQGLSGYLLGGTRGPDPPSVPVCGPWDSTPWERGGAMRQNQQVVVEMGWELPPPLQSIMTTLLAIAFRPATCLTCACDSSGGCPDSFPSPPSLPASSPQSRDAVHSNSAPGQAPFTRNLRGCGVQAP